MDQRRSIVVWLIVFLFLYFLACLCNLHKNCTLNKMQSYKHYYVVVIFNDTSLLLLLWFLYFVSLVCYVLLYALALLCSPYLLFITLLLKILIQLCESTFIQNKRRYDICSCFMPKYLYFYISWWLNVCCLCIWCCESINIKIMIKKANNKRN